MRQLTIAVLSLALASFAAFLPAHSQDPKKKADKKAVKEPEKKPAKPPRATPAESLKLAKGFKAELLYSVPMEQYGSWVNMCHDPKGRLIVSDQYGALYRLTPPPIGTTAAPAIEKIPAAIIGAQGLVWAFDALYVVVNAKDSGLYKVTSSKNDDVLDHVEKLKAFQGGGGEHGPHAVIKHPDGKRLTVVCGNQTKLIDTPLSRVPRNWGEDHLLPRMPDGRNFMKGVNGPGGTIYNVSPDGKDWDILCVGFRNEFDAAYNAAGDLFTYDADMEWDFNTPWYRPTRVCHVVSGGEYGWRNGAGKYPQYYADNLPPVVNIGPGSPTGVCFGYGSKFPLKYQQAMFISDWSYGKLYAVHLKAAGATYTADVEEFIAGTPLPLTDVIVNPADGAMYFLIGGRKTQSGLYRVTATEGATPAMAVAPATETAPKEVVQREFCEQFHGKPANAEQLAKLLEYLNSDDRFVRFSARAALEFQPAGQWKDAVLNASQANQIIHGILALCRVSAPCPHHANDKSPEADATLGKQMLDKLNSLDFAQLTAVQKLDAVRTYHVLFNRFGKPRGEKNVDALIAPNFPLPNQRKDTLGKFESIFPTGGRFLDGEIAQILVALESPVAASAIVKALERAPGQEEQIEYARALRVLKTGWNEDLRKRYFAWMQKADGFRGGNSFGGFLSQIRNDAVANLSVEDKAKFAGLLEVKVKPKEVVKINRPLVKQYKMDDLEPILEKGLTGGRNFEKGRVLFSEARCGACHRFADEGGISGPDLTQAAGRFSPKDLLTSVIEPSKEISDQYAAVEVETADGKKIVGRIVNHNPGGMVLNTDLLDPTATIVIKSDNVESIKNSKLSLMPAGLFDTLTESEVLDVMAYILSRGDKSHAMFKK